MMDNDSPDNAINIENLILLYVIHKLIT